MSRAQHGKYDHEKNVPDNNGQAVGSGTYVWFMDQVKFFLPNAHDLIKESKQHGANKYNWLCAKLVEAGEQGIVDELQRRRKEDAAQQRIQDRRNWIKSMNKQLEDETIHLTRKQYLKKEIAKAQKYIDQRSM